MTLLKKKLYKICSFLKKRGEKKQKWKQLKRIKKPVREVVTCTANSLIVVFLMQMKTEVLAHRSVPLSCFSPKKEFDKIRQLSID